MNLGFDHAFLYSNGHMTDLGTLPGLYNSEGHSINNAGQVTGFSEVDAFIYTNGHMTDLGTLPGFISSIGNAINDVGQVTGTVGNGKFSHAFLYSNGHMMDLGTLPGFTDSVGNSINNAGQVTGDSDTPYYAGGEAFLYSNGHMTDLGTLPGFAGSSAAGINSAGQVVGTAFNGVSDRAFLYSNGHMTDLNTLIDPTLEIHLFLGKAINDKGQIVAQGGDRAFLLTPAPEPSTWALFGIAFLTLLGWRLSLYGEGVAKQVEPRQGCLLKLPLTPRPSRSAKPR
jgi:probable HAF family extracellular repeat protein